MWWLSARAAQARWHASKTRMVGTYELGKVLEGPGAFILDGGAVDKRNQRGVPPHALQQPTQASVFGSCMHGELEYFANRARLIKTSEPPCWGNGQVHAHASVFRAHLQVYMYVCISSVYVCMHIYTHTHTYHITHT
jgi:hypothetical protein